MKVFRSSDDQQEANVWPAVTDSILLLASIFIVLSVVAMLTVTNKLADYQSQKGGSEGTVCVVYRVKADQQFKLGKAELSDPTSARETLESYLKDMTKKRETILKDAEAEWGDSFYLVLEVAGHTDNQGERKQNWELSTDRARTFINLIEDILEKDKDLKKGLALATGPNPKKKDTLLRAAAYCYSAPFDAVGNKTNERLKKARSNNRRVEIRLFAQPMPLVHLQKDPKS